MTELKILNLKIDMQSENNVVVYVEKLHPITGQVYKLHETWWFDYTEKIYDVLLKLFSIAGKDNFELKAECYRIIQMFARELYTGFDFRAAMAARI